MGLAPESEVLSLHEGDTTEFAIGPTGTHTVRFQRKRLPPDGLEFDGHYSANLVVQAFRPSDMSLDGDQRTALFFRGMRE